MAEKQSMEHRLAVDVGGTFIDYILMDESTGDVHIDKQPASADNIIEEFSAGLRRLPVEPGDLDAFIHGTTVAVNALVQHKGAKVGLITTEGFRDVLEIQRGGRPEVYNLQYVPAAPLVPRYLRKEVKQRTTARGDVLIEIDLEDVREQVDGLLANGVEAIAVCLLHSYSNPEHEQTIASFIREEYPEISVSVSSDLVREWREFERSSTTVINAYLQPLFGKYAGNVEQLVRDNGYERQIAFMRSNGGVMPIQDASLRPVETLGSGPAGGVIGAHALMEAAGYANVVCADVGGTTYDVALIQDGEIVERSHTDIDGRPIMGSVIDIVSVGAGGGSIAQIDAVSGSLRVGPESAGAKPGPACFGKGGTKPTVTDAQVILGLLDPDRFLGGRMTLDRGRAEQAIRDSFGEDADALRLAAGILTIAQTNMANAIRVMTTQRGLDPREFAMLSFGGGGGLFAAGVAEELGMSTVIVPQSAAGFSAWGMLMADYREDRTKTALRDVDASTIGGIVDDLRELAIEAGKDLVSYGFAESRLDYRYSADVRFAGQDHTITTPIDVKHLESDSQTLIDALKNEFVARHRQLYGHGDPANPIQVVTVRSRSVAPSSRTMPTPVRTDAPLEAVASRPIYFPETGWSEQVPVFERTSIAEGQRVEGPAIVDEWTTTVVVPPRWNATADGLGNLIITFTKEGE